MSGRMANVSNTAWINVNNDGEHGEHMVMQMLLHVLAADQKITIHLSIHHIYNFTANCPETLVIRHTKTDQNSPQLALSKWIRFLSSSDTICQCSE